MSDVFIPRDKITLGDGIVVTFPPDSIDVVLLLETFREVRRSRSRLVPQQAQWDPQLISPAILRKEARAALEQVRSAINSTVGRGKEQRQLGSEAQQVLDGVFAVIDSFINELRDE